METDQPVATDKTYELPPLILHPFSDPEGPSTLIESSRAGLILEGLLPAGEYSTEELERKLIDGRYCELRMLFYVGRDVSRWLEQCIEFASRQPELQGLGIRELSFAHLLVENPPLEVRNKLVRWGVSDYRAIFCRAIGLNAVFETVPPREILTSSFVRNYYRYADWIFACYLKGSSYTRLSPEQFTFHLYASGEYTRLLEQEWRE